MYTFAPERIPTANAVEAYTLARQLQRRVRQAGEELAMLNGGPSDLDPAVDAVRLEQHSLSDIAGATGTAQFKDGKLFLLELKGDKDSLHFSNRGTYEGFHGGAVTMVESLDGSLSIGGGGCPDHTFVPQITTEISPGEARWRLLRGIYTPNEMEAYIKARELQKRIRHLGDEMAALDQKPADLDPKKGRVKVQNGDLRLMSDAKGTSSFAKGKLRSLSVEGEQGAFQMRKLSSGATAYLGEDMLVVEARDGQLWIDTKPGPDLESAVQKIVPSPGLGKRLTELALQGFDTAFFGAIDAVGRLQSLVFDSALRALDSRTAVRF